MKDLNKVILVGRLTKDPELKNLRIGENDRSVCNFSIAVNREKDKDAFFFNVECWGKLAEIVQKYCVRGKQVALSGYLQHKKWEKEGKKGQSVTIVAEDVHFLGSKKDSEGGSNDNDQSWDDDKS